MLVRDQEWEVLSQDDLSAATLAEKKHQDWLKRIEKADNKSQYKEKKKKLQKAKAVKKEAEGGTDGTDGAVERSADEPQEMDDFTRQVKDLLAQLKKRSPQYALNGYENIWIVKPASKWHVCS